MTSDLNVKIGSEITGYEKIMSKHRFGIRDEHGEYFTNFCAVNQYVKGGSVLPYKGIHKTMYQQITKQSIKLITSELIRN